MKKRFLPAAIFIIYIIILIKVMVFKDIPTIRVGQLLLNFGGADGGHPANFVPFATIMPYLFGYKGWIIAGINLVGNIILLVPIGFLVSYFYSNMNWKKSLILGVISGLTIEVMQTVLHVGIFDIDDVILNALGVMIGWWSFIILAKWMRERKYIHILVVALIIIAAALSALYAIYPYGEPVVNPRVGVDLCGGTGGTGQIVSTGNNSIVMKQKEGTNRIIKLTDQTKIKTSAGTGSESDLKIGDRITLVGGPNPDGSFTAEAVFVCNASSQETN